MCPKNFRTLLRPVNVCCAIVASRFVAPGGNEPSEKRLPPSPGLNFDPFRGLKPVSRGASPEFVLQTFKTQNDARGANTHPPVQTMSSRTAKARNCPSPDGL